MIIFVGVAGAGKSVQGKLLASDLQSPYFSMGDFLRSHVNNNLREKMISGDLINDEEVINVLSNALEEIGIDDKEFILDGFPRTLLQTDWLVNQVRANKFSVRAVIHLMASPEVILPRLLERHRHDDKVEVINKRVDEYQHSISQIVKKLRDGGIRVYDVNAERTPNVIHEEIMNLLS